MKSDDIRRRTSTRCVSGSRRATISGTDKSSRLATSTSNRYASRICRSSSAFPGSLAGNRAHPATNTPRRVNTTAKNTQCGRAERTTAGMGAPRLMAVVGAGRCQDTNAPWIAPNIGNLLYLVCPRVDDVHRIIRRKSPIDLRATRRRRRRLQGQISADLQACDEAKRLHVKHVDHRIAPANDV